MSPISAAMVSPSSSATPGVLISSRARSSARASGRRSRSSGASWRAGAAGTPHSLARQGRALGVEVVDDAEQRGQRGPPALGNAVLGELVERAGLAQRGQAAPQAPL